jgi:hypothetical protein
MFHKRSSVINLIYSVQHFFSYSMPTACQEFVIDTQPCRASLNGQRFFIKMSAKMTTAVTIAALAVLALLPWAIKHK